MTNSPVYYVSPRLRGAMLEEHADALHIYTTIIRPQHVSLPAPIGAGEVPALMCGQ
ncbi:hypothetical protein [Thioclava sp. DLFJ4-1]|uniref:hypothetical protein n=1 Tax=Thioclava sp. DLFJ4-1 TaxID=1915313 RepID=UPI00143A988A|nr:hypothetical protein [Thioclava sp. DLFJ4-1]